MNKKVYNVWFSGLDISNRTKLILLEQYTSREIFDLTFEDLLNMSIDEIDIVNILKNKSMEIPRKNWEIMKKEGIKLISIRDHDKYPKKLRNISNNPAFLYVRGDENILDDDAVGIVGCRMCSYKGRDIARMIARDIGNKNINIVSGLAVGIDKFAHLGALDSYYGKTIAVLGAGVESSGLYPMENRKVYERIIQSGGVIVSEYPIGSKPERHHFPERNRIISGLSDKIIVVEATGRSGSLITVNWALEQGKDVFAVPGSILSQNSVGTNKLIKEGAYLFSRVEDIL